MSSLNGILKQDHGQINLELCLGVVCWQWSGNSKLLSVCCGTEDMKQHIGFSVWGEGYTHGMQGGFFDTGQQLFIVYIDENTSVSQKSYLALTSRPNMFP